MNVTSTAFNEADVVREATGRFGEKPQSAPELALGGPEPIIINSPVGGDGRRANLWIKIPEGQATEMNVFEAGIGRAEEEMWREDTITFRATDEGIRAVYEVIDEDINYAFAEAFDELDEAESDSLKMTLRNEVITRSGGTTDVLFQDNQVQFRHVSDHDIDDDGGFYTAVVFDRLESNPSYVMARDGVHFPAAYAALAEFGFEN